MMFVPEGRAAFLFAVEYQFAVVKDRESVSLIRFVLNGVEFCVVDHKTIAEHRPRFDAAEGGVGQRIGPDARA